MGLVFVCRLPEPPPRPGGRLDALPPRSRGGKKLKRLAVEERSKTNDGDLLEPEIGFEPTTYALRVRCSTGLSYPGGGAGILVVSRSFRLGRRMATAS